jgi:alpha-methylacyl-CoA racemase
MRVVDLSSFLPGPYATMLLADLGADVLHIEPPGGEPGRHLPSRIGDDSVLHWWVGRNKQSLVLDLKRPEDRARFLAEVARADVVVEGFRPGVAARLGVDYEACRAVNPSIIYCAITGYGQTTPHAGAPGHDLNYGAKAGVAGLCTDDGGTPVMVGFPLTDVAGGLHAAVGILAAYVHRLGTGLGQYLDVSILGASLGLVGMQLMKALAGEVPTKGEDMNLGADPAYALYRSGDGRFLSVACVEEKFWKRFCALLDRPDLVPRRHSEPAAVRRELAEIFATADRGHWDLLFEHEEVCYAPVHRIDEVARDPDVRDFVLALPDGDGIERPTLGNPIRMSGTPPRAKDHAPALRLPD